MSQVLRPNRRLPSLVSLRLFSTANDDKPPLYEYEAPKDDSYKNFQSTQQFVRRYFILFPLALYCLYEAALVRRNKFSKQKQYKLFNRAFESFVVGGLITSSVNRAKRNLIFKQSTEEVQLVNKVLERIINANGLERYLQNLKVVLIHDPFTVLLFLNFDKTLFITTKALEVTGMVEGELALLLSHELAHYLLEHQVERTFGFLTEVYLRPYWDQEKSSDPIAIDFQQKAGLQGYSCYYAHQRNVNKYVERHCDQYALHLWKTAFPQSDVSSAISSLFGSGETMIEVDGSIRTKENMSEHLRKTPSLNLKKARFDPTYTYAREETLLQLAAQPLQSM